MAELRLGNTVFFLLAKADLDGFIPVRFSRFALNHTARSGFNHRHRHHLTLIIEDLGHS